MSLEFQNSVNDLVCQFKTYEIHPSLPKYIFVLSQTILSSKVFYYLLLVLFISFNDFLYYFS